MATNNILPRVLGGPSLPPALRQHNDAGPAFTFTVRGNGDLLNHRLVGFFCSESLPGDAILSAYDLALALRDTGTTFIGGFQSAMEKEFLTFVLRGSAPVIVCPARGIGRMRLPAPWRAPLEEGRLLLLSCFDDKTRRPTKQTVAKRNALVAELAACLLVPHAAPGGKVEQLCQRAITQGKQVFTSDSADPSLVKLGATKLRLDKQFNFQGWGETG